MARITDLGSLRNAVRLLTNRSDTVLTNEIIDGCIQNAETIIYRRLRTPANEGLDEFIPTADTDKINISPDFIEFRLLSVNNVPREQQSMRDYMNGNEGYCRFGSRIAFNPIILKNDKVLISYYEALSLFSDTQTEDIPSSTNAVLIASPNVYLYGAVSEAFKVLQEYEASEIYMAKCNEEVTNMNNQARHSELSGGKLQIGSSAYTNNITTGYTTYKL